MIIHARNSASGGQWAALEKMLGNPDTTDLDMARARDILADTGSLEYAQRLMDRYLAETNEALTVLNATGFADETIEFYRGMVDFIGKRRH